ncbi:unnamed protein product [Parascedosporium putredinis]|uniref:Uncharacterized protein n=1 Tax=Parascedosporium putredinis TaxID=1442378 RepID=A0A9P1M6I4_9PEZI|nr:unnamed protein product [Parascedosporium putredinis]CAI7988463.1 unnamed protein product [Parascedosporium putredinis]
MSRDNDTSRGGGGDNFFDAPQYDDDSHRDIGRKSPSDPCNSSLYDTELMVSDNDEDPEGGTQGQEAAPEQISRMLKDLEKSRELEPLGAVGFKAKIDANNR